MKYIFLYLFLFSFQISFSQNLYRYAVDGKFGYMNSKKEVVIKPQYSSCSSFNNGLAKVKSGNKYGFIDTKNKWIIAPNFDNTSDFKEGVAVVYIGDSTGLINTKGEYLVKLEYGIQIREPSEGRLLVIKNNIYGFIDLNGKKITEIDLTSASDFNNGFAKVEVEAGRFGYINKTGKLAIPAVYLVLSDAFNEGVAVVYNENGCTYIDTTGKQIINKYYASGTSFHNGKALVCDSRESKTRYFINKNGLKVFEVTGNQYVHIGNGFYSVYSDSINTVFNNIGEIVFNSKTMEISSIENGFVFFNDYKQEGYTGIMNSKFEPFTNLRFNERSININEFIEVRIVQADGTNDEKAHINKNGKILVKWIEPQ